MSFSIPTLQPHFQNLLWVRRFYVFQDKYDSRAEKVHRVPFASLFPNVSSRFFHLATIIYIEVLRKSSLGRGKLNPAPPKTATFSFPGEFPGTRKKSKAKT